VRRGSWDLQAAADYPPARGQLYLRALLDDPEAAITGRGDRPGRGRGAVVTGKETARESDELLAGRDSVHSTKRQNNHTRWPVPAPKTGHASLGSKHGREPANGVELPSDLTREIHAMPSSAIAVDLAAQQDLEAWRD
jgi:hypothetical protein